MAGIVAKHRYQMNICNSFNGQYFNLYVRRFFFGLVYTKKCFSITMKDTYALIWELVVFDK